MTGTYSTKDKKSNVHLPAAYRIAIKKSLDGTNSARARDETMKNKIDKLMSMPLPEYKHMAITTTATASPQMNFNIFLLCGTMI